MSDSNEKKDLTGIFQLTPSAEEAKRPLNPNDVEKKVEKIDSFESLDQLGLLDHPVPEEPTPSPEAGGGDHDFPISASEIANDPFAEPTSEDTVEEADPFAVSESAPDQLPETNEDFALSADPFASINPSEEKAPDDFTEVKESFSDPFNDFSPSPPSPENAAAAAHTVESLRHYSENAQEAALRQNSSREQTPAIFHPYHLYIQGDFGPFEQDKLLLFITENQIGMTSSDLTLQIKSNRVLLPRISEYAGIKLIQEMRDSGLKFSLKESDGFEAETHAEPVHFHYSGENRRATDSLIGKLPIFNEQSAALSQYQEIDSVRAEQFVKAEMIEFEKSEILQEVIERMTETLKKKASLKGADALSKLKQTITPLRLPSQYQISLQASVLKKI